MIQPQEEFPRRIGDCWNRIGTFGDRSCPELEEANHCLNCFVYSSAGRVLLERKPTQGMRQEWTRQMAQELDLERKDTVSLIGFRIGKEHLALETQVFAEIFERRPIHSIPHRRNSALLGITNHRGEILLCMCLTHILGIRCNEETAKGCTKFPRMMLTEYAGLRWVIPADEVFGMTRYVLSDIQNVPSTLEQNISAYTKGILYCRKQPVALLDEAKVFEQFAGSVRA